MPKVMRSVISDDFDGKELPEDTAPIQLRLGRTTYSLYLSDKNHGKLLEALEPFTKDAEKASGGGAPRSTGKGGSGRSKEELAEIRAWAQQNGHKVSERGRVSKEILEAWDAK